MPGEGWSRMGDGRWHFFVGNVSACTRWVSLSKYGEKWHHFPSCMECMKARYGNLLGREA